jgi:hypothetical protein
MGADMLLYYCEYPTSYKKAMPTIEYRIENLADKTLNFIAEELLWCEANDLAKDIEKELKEEDLYKLNDLIGIKTREMIRGRIRQAIEDMSDWRRDIACLTLGGTNYIFSGGLSWGDLPTDACEMINLVSDSGVLDGMGHVDFDYDSFKC